MFLVYCTLIFHVDQILKMDTTVRKFKFLKGLDEKTSSQKPQTWLKSSYI